MGIFKHSLDMLSVPLTVAAGIKAGDTYLIGTGLLAIAITDRYVAADYAKGGSKYPSTPPQGLTEGQAMVCLPQVRAISERESATAGEGGAIAAGDTVYRILTDADATANVGKVSTTHTAGDSRVLDGVALEAIVADGKGLVAHVIAATPVQ